MNAKWIGCAPNNFHPGRPVGIRPELIVIHVIVGTLESADQWFNNPAAMVSAHYGVGCDGRVHQYVAETDTAFHAGVVVNPNCALVLARPRVNPNYYSIGIEHEGQPGDDWTTEQLASSAALIAEISQRWNVPLDAQHVIQHRDIRASKTCPGRQQKVNALIGAARSASVRRILISPAPAGPAPRVLVASTAPAAPQESNAEPAPASTLQKTPGAVDRAVTVQEIRVETAAVQSVGPAPPVAAAPASVLQVTASPEPSSTSGARRASVPSPDASPSNSPVPPVSVERRTVRVITNVRVRKGAPSSAAPVVNVLQANAVIHSEGAVTGESIQGNPIWYRDADGNFVWAGGTDVPDPKTTATA